MTYEIVVVGGGIGGLTTAALLAARGLDVCLFEREAQGGGCASTFEKFGYRFELGAGLYASWQPGEIHERVFDELPARPPEVREVAPAYVVRLPDDVEVSVGGDSEKFEEQLRTAFPECATEACAFYREIESIAGALSRAALRVPSLATVSKFERMKLIAREARISSRVLARMNQTAAEHLQQTSTRFRRFVDVQLQIFAQVPSDECAYLYAAVALMQPRRGMYAIGGGASSLIDALVDSIKLSGGTVRFDSTVLRLVYDAGGRAAGVDLLSGERVEASRGVVSNLTVWDTYGKLVGTSRTPAEVRARLKNLKGWGAYQIYLGMDEAAAARLPSDHVLALTGWQEGQLYDPQSAQFMFSAAPRWDARAPEGKRAVTVSTFTEAEDWFAFHEDEAEHEAQDQSALEACWSRIHAALPELGDGVEVIETATPRTFYERTRRRLGMTGGVGQTLAASGANALTHRTILPNLYMVGDTIFPGNGVAAVTQSALALANEIAPPR
ncbi:MAG TPA: NAD(P)/FAD-dependent oxidoreductase [Pyrinomonadaceae bacterium]|nr:NAD(P)/FAD-dependent oxidoreductase [Pyrinomonadaceae bacterium]